MRRSCLRLNRPVFLFRFPTRKKKMSPARYLAAVTARKFISAALERARAVDPFLSLWSIMPPQAGGLAQHAGSVLRKRNCSAIIPYIVLTHLWTHVGGKWIDCRSCKPAGGCANEAPFLRPHHPSPSRGREGFPSRKKSIHIRKYDYNYVPGVRRYFSPINPRGFDQERTGLPVPLFVVIATII